MTTCLTELARATRLIGGIYDGPNCVEAAALTVEVGARLGFELNARPVSMFAATYDGRSTATGVQGRAFGENFLRSHGAEVEFGGEFTGGTAFQRQAGHMIVLSAEQRLLLDPTFHQFHHLGEAATALFVSEVDARANGRFWHVEGDTFFVRYFSADDFPEEGFDEFRIAATTKADEIVNHLRR